MPHSIARRTLAFSHALYFICGGIWALIGKRTFQEVTGPKTDYWLVRTVGALLTTTGLVIASASLRDRITPEISWLANGSSASLAAISAIYAGKGRIRKIYLLDTLANVLLILGWRKTSGEMSSQ